MRQLLLLNNNEPRQANRTKNGEFTQKWMEMRAAIQLWVNISSIHRHIHLYVIKATITTTAHQTTTKRERESEREKKPTQHKTANIGHQRWYKVVARKSFVIIWLYVQPSECVWVWRHWTNLMRRYTFTKWWHDTCNQETNIRSSGGNSERQRALAVSLCNTIHHTYQSNHKTGNNDEDVSDKIYTTK